MPTPVLTSWIEQANGLTAYGICEIYISCLRIIAHWTSQAEVIDFRSSS
jgi:hypothetical protein